MSELRNRHGRPVNPDLDEQELTTVIEDPDPTDTPTVEDDHPFITHPTVDTSNTKPSRTILGWIKDWWIGIQERWLTLKTKLGYGLTDDVELTTRGWKKTKLIMFLIMLILSAFIVYAYSRCSRSN